MKIGLCLVLQILLLSGLACNAIAAEELPKSVKLRADEFAPFNSDPKASKPGFVIEMLQEIFARQGIVLDYKVMPWSRSVRLAEKGEIDGILITDQEESPGLVFPEEPQAMYRGRFFYLTASETPFTGIDSLKGKRLGIANGYVYGESDEGVNLDELFQNNKEFLVEQLSGDNPTSSAILLLKKGRIDYFIESIDVFNSVLDASGFRRDEFSKSDAVKITSPQFVGFSAKHPYSKRLALIVSEGTRELRASGRLKEILDRYGVEDWK